ncbi:MAG TPA: carboxypeptidase regulatory-like domain-containing protein [Gemmatimonadaceae bacterium]|nr:carboxypeptidase regulatory-like domain-containing protein [Gemmatimonadaceae bacterium]
MLRRDLNVQAAPPPLPALSMIRQIAVPLVVLPLAAASLHGQQSSASLVGWIRDSSGTPVANAQIEILRASPASAFVRIVGSGRTNDSGWFAVRSLVPSAITVRIRRFGFQPQEFDFTLHDAKVDSVSVTMPQSARLLAAVRTDASVERRKKDLEGFYRRRAKGYGTFITRDDIEARHTNTLSDMVRDLPGIRVVHAGTGRQGVRFDLSNAKAIDCPPQYWIDGRRVPNTDIDDYPATDVEGIELYAGPASTPLEFSQTASRYTCGTIVIWTRIPGTPDQH